MGASNDLVEFNNFAHGHAIAKEAGTSFNPLSDIVIARTMNGELIGGCVYQNYTGKSIGIHVSGFKPGWISRDLLWICFHYPFIQLGCEYLFGLAPAFNLKAVEFNRKMGFTEVTRIEHVFPEGDMVVFRMHRDECRFLMPKKSDLQA